MMDERRLTHVLNLHEKSYALLLWVQSSLRTGRLSFAMAHDATNTEGAAREWVQRHRENMPEDARPEPSDVPMFARLFLSFLKTSFLLDPKSTQLVSPCGCWCSFCTYLRQGPNLAPRTPTKKHVALALELKKIYLSRLAPGISPDVFEAMLVRPDLRESIAMTTWGAEMLRRSEFASQGEAVLALWREFAWRHGRPRRGFKISAQAICGAEQVVHAALIAEKGQSG